MKSNLKRLTRNLLLGLLTLLLVAMPISLPLPGGGIAAPLEVGAQSSKTMWTLFPAGTRGTTTGGTRNLNGTNALGVIVYLNVTAQAGTNPTLDVKLQDSPDGSIWFDVPGGAFTQVTAATGQQTLVPTRGLGNYMRAVATVGGSSTPTFTFSVLAVTYFAPAVDVTTTIAGNATFTQWTLQGTNGQSIVYGMNSEVLTLATGATTTDTTGNLLPARSIIDSVTAIVTTTITTAASWGLGDPTTAARFTAVNAGAVALGSQLTGLDHWSGAVTTLAAGPSQAAAAKVRVTTNANPGAGAVRIVVLYHQVNPPSS